MYKSFPFSKGSLVSTTIGNGSIFANRTLLNVYEPLEMKNNILVSHM